MFKQRCTHITRSLKAIKHPSARHHKWRKCEQTNLESVINSYPQGHYSLEERVHIVTHMYEHASSMTLRHLQ